MTGFSFARFIAMLRKEWLQMRRDRMTVGMTVMLPLLQLFLFGTPSTPTRITCRPALLSADHSIYERTLVTALQNTGYFDVRDFATEQQADARWRKATCCSCWKFRPASRARWIVASIPRCCWTPTRPIRWRSATRRRRSRR